MKQIRKLIADFGSWMNELKMCVLSDTFFFNYVN